MQKHRLGLSKTICEMRYSDSYGVSIADGIDEIPILCTCIVIDQVLNDEQDSRT
jgi:uncharacterized protein YxjI